MGVIVFIPFSMRLDWRMGATIDGKRRHPPVQELDRGNPAMKPF
jgi:hypothetical protein